LTIGVPKDYTKLALSAMPMTLMLTIYFFVRICFYFMFDSSFMGFNKKGFVNQFGHYYKVLVSSLSLFSFSLFFSAYAEPAFEYIIIPLLILSFGAFGFVDNVGEVDKKQEDEYINDPIYRGMAGNLYNTGDEL